MRLLLKLIFIALAITGCSDDDFSSTEVERGQDYNPVKVDSYWIYDIEKTHYSISGEITRTHTMQRITVTDSVVIEGEASFTLRVEEKSSEQEEWERVASWEYYSNDYIAVMNEGSLPLVKLSFPIEADRSWNINSLNSLPEDLIKYDSLSRPYTLNEVTYNNSITVVIDNEDDNINITADDIFYEVYAKNVGLIYLYDVELAFKSCSSQYPSCCDENGINICFDEILEGYILKKTLIEFGSQ